MPRGALFTLLALVALVAIARLGPFGSDGGGSPGATATAGQGGKRPAPAAVTGNEDDGGSDLPPRLALGQMIAARFDGGDPSAAFLARIERGEIGAVILFSEGLRGGNGAIAARVGRLQEAAAEGHNPPLLVMVDQEGGTVKRLPGPPHDPAAAMDAAEAGEEGEATGQLLAELGFNVDLAPVADVGHRESFLGTRTFSSDPEEVAEAACAFATGLRDKGVAATLKHFPGLGRAEVNTDQAPATVSSSASRLRADYAPYQRCAGEPLTLVMVDSAVYPNLTGDQPAVMSPATYRHELPLAGATGVTISDDLETPAIQSRLSPARSSINAGLDLLLYARTESTSAEAYDRLLEDLEAGAISKNRVATAAAAIVGLKEELGQD